VSVSSSGVTAVVLNLTAVAASGGGVIAYPSDDGTSVPSSASINCANGKIDLTAEMGTVAFVSANDVNDWISIYSASGGGADVILDVPGYFENSRVLRGCGLDGEIPVLALGARLVPMCSRAFRRTRVSAHCFAISGAKRR
jgi:hypothetical protein